MRPFIVIADYCYAASLRIASYFVKTHDNDFKPELSTVVIIPGVYETSLYFNDISKAISATHNVVHAESIYGKSRDIDQDALSISDYITGHGLTGVVLIGHSSGGLTAVKSLNHCADRVSKVITIATPYHGVKNGHLLRTKIVRELLPGSRVIKSMTNLKGSIMGKVVSLYPSFDNQVWSKRGSYIEGAKNVRVRAKGHHLILRSRALRQAVLAELEV